jgi:homoserine kinase type II
MAEPSFHDIDEVLRRYGFTVTGPPAVVRVGGGFSGADVWRVDTTAGMCCLRRWPASEPGRDRLRWIHTILRQAYFAGCRFLPLPLAAEDAATAVIQAGRLWELTNWLDGRADDSPSLDERRMTSAVRAFAQFHRTLCDEPWASVAAAPSPGLVDRLERLDHGLATGLADLRAAEIPLGWSELAARRDEYLRLFGRAAAIVRPHVSDFAGRSRILQPCIRDLRREHLLFDGDELCGLVDFGAMQMEHPAIDVARLLGECVGDDRARRDAALAEYRAAAGPALADAADPAVVGAFDAGNLVLSPYNWLRWILVEGRDFADRRAVLQRLDALLARLQTLVDRG